MYEVFAAFQKDSRRIVLADVILAQNGETLIPRNSGDELITVSEDYPRFNRPKALKLLPQKNMAKKRQYRGQIRLKDTSTDDCYGKVIGTFGYRLLKFLLNKYGVTNTLPKDLASTLVINNLSEKVWKDSARQHYGNQMETLRGAL